MKRAKKQKPDRYHLTRAEIKEMAQKQVEKSFLLMATAAADELELSEDQLQQIAERAARYAEYIDQHLVRLNEVSEILQARGISWRW